MLGIRAPECSKLAKNPKNDNGITVFWHGIIFTFFWRCFFSLVKFGYWSKFHINIITGSGIMTIFFYNALTRNPDMGNTPVWVLPNIWRLGRVMDTKFGKNVSNRMLLKAAKSRVAAFTVFELSRENQLGGNITPLSPPRLGLRALLYSKKNRKLIITCFSKPVNSTGLFDFENRKKVLKF